MKLYPLVMNPYFRHGAQTPWGGSTLQSLFGKATPGDKTGESLEVSAFAATPSSIKNGVLAGKTVIEAAGILGQELTGPIAGEFPLMLKLIDASEMLSLQVHPGDEYAAANENGKFGKTEAWVILSAPHGAQLAYGVNCDKETLRRSIADGTFESQLRFIKVAPGDVLYIPHGMVHAIGEGIILYEIQQSSDVTYRFYDWGRTDASGNSRELHIDKAFDVTDCSLHLDKLPGATIIMEGGSMTAYISDDIFELWRLNVAGNMPLMAGRMMFLTPLGPLKLHYPDGELDIAPFETVVIPAALSGVSIEGRLPVLMSTTPDTAFIKEQLGYRAEAVAGVTL